MTEFIFNIHMDEFNLIENIPDDESDALNSGDDRHIYGQGSPRTGVQHHQPQDQERTIKNIQERMIKPVIKKKRMKNTKGIG